jgi:RimJ/RimL family protein N-acetyltransferase
MPFIVQSLHPGARAALAAHLLALPRADRRLRFGAVVAEESIRRYVGALDFSRDGLFGVRDRRLTLVGTAHLARTEDGAELALSVVPAQRLRGIGQALFARAVQFARNRGIARLYMHCLAENEAMLHIARAAGMRVELAAGEADAHLALQPATIETVAGELLMEQMALVDYTAKAQRITAGNVRDALRQWTSGYGSSFRSSVFNTLP